MDNSTRRALQAIVQHQITEAMYVNERKDLWKLYHEIEMLEKQSSGSSWSFFKMFTPHLPVLGMLAAGFVVALFMLGNLTP